MRTGPITNIHIGLTLTWMIIGLLLCFEYGPDFLEIYGGVFIGLCFLTMLAWSFDV